VPYLTEDAVHATLGFIASLSGGAHVVFDYANPPDAMSGTARALHDELATFFTPQPRADPSVQNPRWSNSSRQCERDAFGR
jgi:O-methyltransferase involved in polyketide biosynthesis